MGTDLHRARVGCPFSGLGQSVSRPTRRTCGRSSPMRTSVLGPGEQERAHRRRGDPGRPTRASHALRADYLRSRERGRGSERARIGALRATRNPWFLRSRGPVGAAGNDGLRWPRRSTPGPVPMSAPIRPRRRCGAGLQDR
jgi:hypothetical protein